MAIKGRRRKDARLRRLALKQGYALSSPEVEAGRPTNASATGLSTPSESIESGEKVAFAFDDVERTLNS